jgi:hypothetical protein
MSGIISKYNLGDIGRQEKTPLRTNVFTRKSRGFCKPTELRAQLSNAWAIDMKTQGARSAETGEGLKDPWTPDELEKMDDYFWFSCLGDRIGWKGGFATAAILRKDLDKVDFTQDGNLYETLTPNLMVKPFFDLEAYIPIEEFHEEANRLKFLNAFIQVLVFKVKTLTGVDLDPNTDFFITQACRPEADNKTGKVSYHLIIQNKVYFKTITDHKVFVEALFIDPFLAYLAHLADTSNDEINSEISAEISAEDWAYLEATTYVKGGVRKSLLDASVYDCDVRHTCQQFKMPYQSKGGAPGSIHVPIRGECANGWEQLCGLYFGPGEERKLIDVEGLLEGETRSSTKPQRRIRIRRAENGGIHTSYPHTRETFVFEGKTLQEIKTKTLQDLIDFPDAKAYLYLIPNGEGVLRPFWLHIGFACKAAGLTLEDWNDWTGLYPGHTALTPEMQDIWDAADAPGAKPQYDGSGNRLPGYDIRHLRMVAKQNCYARATKQYAELKKDKRAVKGKVENYFDCAEVALNDYFAQDTTDIEVIKETSKFLSSEEDDANINVTQKHLIYDAAMGKGKTQAIKRIMRMRDADNQPKYESVLFLSTRISFANFITGQDFEDCRLDNYKDAFDERNFSADRLVVSVESICKVDREEGYDLVVLDECESVWKVFSSTTLNGNHAAAYNKLLGFIRGSKRTIYADAFIMNRTLGFVRHLKEPAVMIVNHVPNPDRPVRTTYELSTELLGDEMEKKILEGKKVFICSGSKTNLDKWQYRFQTEHRVQRNAAVWNPVFEPMSYANGTKTRPTSIIYYNADMSDLDDRDTLHHIKETWTKARVVMTTPKITVGCSYSEEGQFHVTGIDFVPSCCVRDLIQTHMRVRSLVNNEVYYAVPSTEKLKRLRFAKPPLVFDTFEYYMAEMRERTALRISELERLKNDLKSTTSAIGADFKTAIDVMVGELQQDNSPYELKRLLWQNILEDALSVKYYAEMVDYFLHRKMRYINGMLPKAAGGGEPAKKKMKPEKKKENDRPVTYEEKYSYKNLAVIEPEQVNDFIHFQRTKSASELDKLRLAKYFFNKLVDTDEMFEKEIEAFFQMYKSSAGKVYLTNASIEHLSAPDIIASEVESKQIWGTEAHESKALCAEVIQRLLEILGMSNSFYSFSLDEKGEKIPVTETLKNDLQSYFTERVNGEEKRANTLYRIFVCIGTGNPGALKEKSEGWNWQKTLNALNYVFGNWTGGKFKSDLSSTDARKKNAKFIIFYPNSDLFGDNKQLVFRQKTRGWLGPADLKWEDETWLWKKANKRGIFKTTTVWDTVLKKYTSKMVPLDRALELVYQDIPECVVCQLPVASFTEGVKTCQHKPPLFYAEEVAEQGKPPIPFVYDEEADAVVYESASEDDDVDEGEGADTGL